jgi:HD-GYP domain-containing protein (c-di-GMP phosphodiesterase class II)
MSGAHNAPGISKGRASMVDHQHKSRGGVLATRGTLPPVLRQALASRGFAVAELKLGEAGPQPSPPTRAKLNIAVIGTAKLPADPGTAETAIARVVATGCPIVLVGPATPATTEALAERVHAWLPLPLEEPQLLTAIRSGFAVAAARAERDAAQELAELKTAEAKSLYEIGTALSAERNLNRLQELILRRCRELTGADAGSLYILEENANKRPILRFEVTQNDSVVAGSFRATPMALTDESIAGYVAMTGHTLNLADAYHLPDGEPFRFNDAFDRASGYRTKSMLVVPMRNHEGDVIGVVQLINRKRSFGITLENAAIVEREVEPFPEEAEEVLDSLTSQAAVALNNRLLLDNIEDLFEGFVQASVTAIESRDPTTHGHSERVAKLTVGIARAVTEIGAGRWKEIGFSEQQLREIRYAGLLHDFGKIGVREDVLVKAKKLYDWQLDVIRLRYALLRKTAETEFERKQLEAVLEHGHQGWLQIRDSVEHEHEEQLAKLDDELTVIIRANEPTVLDQQAEERLKTIAARQLNLDGIAMPVLGDDEFLALSVKRGSLTDRERDEIQSHVSHTYRFLSLMPWTRNLKQVPNIAWSHHEKLNGKGYPQGLKGDEIPLQSRMMAIADIHDALTAADRPYKRAVPLAKALDILHDEARGGAIDPELLDIFVQRRIYELVPLGGVIGASSLAIAR